jgi:acetolactate synthase-1/2/3 large subunit
MKVADEVARWLEEKRITDAFGIIGGGNIALWDAIHRRGYTRLRAMHHEQSAAMASAYFNRVDGRLGSIALVTTGAGSTNAITGVVAAHMDGIPLLVISGNEASQYFDYEARDLRIRGVQGYDSAGVAAPFCNFVVRAMNNAGAQAGLAMAWYKTTDQRHGAAWLDIPKDVQNASL